MIGPDDIIGERRSPNHTPIIAFGVAAALLLVVGALTYRDSVRSSLEKEFADKEERLLQRLGYPAATAPSAASASAQPAATAPAAPASAPAAAPAPGTVLYDAQGNPVYIAGTGEAVSASPPLAGRQVESSLPAPEDPDIASLRASLDRAREQSRQTEQRFNEVAGRTDATTPGASAPTADGTGTGNAEITAELPEFLRNAVENPPGGNPELDERLRRMRSQVMAQPSLAKVTSYDSEWGIVTFNAGSAQGVAIDQRFAVRRGADILGWVKVNQVEVDEAIATLVTKNAHSETALKPGVGDDLIDFELF